MTVREWLLIAALLCGALAGWACGLWSPIEAARAVLDAVPPDDFGLSIGG